MTEQDLTYSIIFDIPKDPISVDEFAKGMQETLSSLEEINNAIVCGINSSIKVVSYIESIEAGFIEFKLKDDTKLEKDKEAIEILSASLITVATRDLSSFIPTLLKRCRETIIEIQNRAIENKEKKKLIEEAITKELKDSGINNELIGYYLDKDRLNKAIKHFSGGVKKTGNNVFYKPSAKEDKIKINSSLADNTEDQDKNGQEEEEKILQSTNTIEDIYTLFTPTSKEDYKWEFDDNGSKIKCTMDDKEFFNKYLSKKEKLGGNENLKLKMKIETFLQGNKVKKEYTILKVIEIIPDRNLFNYQDTNKKS